MPNKTLSVLLVEDNILAQRVTKLILQEVGCTTHAVASGSEALECLKEAFYDLVFLDFGLPDMNGLEFAEKFRAAHPEKADIPIVIVSAYSDDTYREQAEALGIREYIVKPISKVTCEMMIRKFFPLNVYEVKT